MKNAIAVSIVEDLADIRNGLKAMLDGSDDFLCISTYEDAESALTGLPEARPDVVIMDINLPGMSGIECIRRVKDACPEMQFVMFTIYENNEQVFDALEAGANGFLLKNTPPPQMLEALRELYSGGSPMSAHIARKVVASFRKAEAQADAAAVLSAREKEVLEALAKGLLYKEIAAKLGISTGTVRQHIHKIYDKLHVQNRTEALNKVYGRQG